MKRCSINIKYSVFFAQRGDISSTCDMGLPVCPENVSRSFMFCDFCMVAQKLHTAAKRVNVCLYLFVLLTICFYFKEENEDKSDTEDEGTENEEDEEREAVFGRRPGKKNM